MRTNGIVWPVEHDVVRLERLELRFEPGAAVAELAELDEVLELQIADVVHHPGPVQRCFLGVTRPFVTGRSIRVESTTCVSSAARP